ncbi:MAG: MBOAT family O-acyltransferase [Lachnospiraceae bacterium]
MVGVTVSAYLHGLLIRKFRGTGWSKVFLLTSVVSSIGVLGFFKYSDFLISNLNAITNADKKLLGLALPIGISFYTFQTISYTIDVYRGETEAQKNFISFATYVTLFTQLIAGPIVRYRAVEGELAHRTHSWDNAAYGIQRFLTGLAKKVLLADLLGMLADCLHTMKGQSIAGCWLYALAVSLQLYFDFSGYSDMAIGLGRIFGFHFPENFRYPFISGSITEFWRRWHITLGTWFRDYVYIPLGGNRVALLHWLFNVLLVWLLTGLWHGADWTFVLWGLYFALFLIMEKLWLKRLLARIPVLFSHLYVILAVMVSFVLFRAEGLAGAIQDLGGLFGMGGIPFWTQETGYYFSSYFVLLAVSIVGATPIPKNVVEKLKENKFAGFSLTVLEPVFYVAVLLLVTAYLVDGSFSPFLYFRF